MKSRVDFAWFTACAAVYLAVATRFSDGFGRTQFDNAAFAHFFDYQAEALLRGDIALEKDAIGLEAFVIDGRDQMYFGLFPALIRVPIEAVTDRFFGSLTLISSFGAWMLFVYAAWALTDCVVERRSAVVRCWKVGVALGTPVFVLAGPVWVFSEAIMWGVAACVWFQYRLYRELEESSPTHQAWLAAALVLAVLNRPTLGLGCVAATGGVAAYRAWRARRPARSDVRLGVIAAAGGIVFVAPNLIRFERLLGPPMQAQGLSMFDAHRMRMLDYAGNDFADVRYLPSNLVAYFRPDGLSLSGRFPFIEAPSQIPTVFGGAIHDITYRTPSLLVSTPIVMIPALIGVGTIVAMVRRRRLDVRARRLTVLAAAAAPAAAALMIWGFIAPRYLADFVPLFLPFAVLGIALVTPTVDGQSDEQDNRRAHRVLVGVALLAGWSVLASSALAVAASYETGYDGDIAEFVDLQGRGDVWVGNERRPTATDFDFDRSRPPTAGDIVILGDCAAAYYSTGEQVDPWLALDFGPNEFRRSYTVEVARDTLDASIELAEFASVEPADDGAVDRFTVILAVRDGSVGIDLVDEVGSVRYDFGGVEPGSSFVLTITSDPVRKVLTFDVDGRAIGYGHVFTRSLYGPSGQTTRFVEATPTPELSVAALPVSDPC